MSSRRWHRWQSFPAAEADTLAATARVLGGKTATDIALGAGMRGTELAAQVQGRFPKMAVLLMSGFSSELLDADRDSPPNWELLHKPYTRDELARAIARVVRSL